jgi:hypothetical protein
VSLPFGLDARSLLPEHESESDDEHEHGSAGESRHEKAGEEK